MIISRRKLLKRLDDMLEKGINGMFTETDYDETLLSKMEIKWLRYLNSSRLSEMRIQQERRNLEEIVSNISHQIRTPLSNIMLYTQLLEEQSLDEQSRQLVDEICIQSDKLKFLIDSLVKTSRLETGTFQFSPGVNSVDELITSAVDQVRNDAESKNLLIRYKPVDEFAVFDSKWTKEALFNILDNAVKYSSENNSISVSVLTYEMFICICVSDNSIGISESEIPMIFRRFYRGQNVRNQNGIGIGLHLSRQIIENQGGYIEVSSKLNEGSVFKIFLQKNILTESLDSGKNDERMI